ncbi:MAG: cardiolipin synthase [Nitrospirota bacterium]
MWTFIILAVLALSIALSCVFIIYEHQSPAATMAWLLAMVLLPFLGLGAYFVFGRRKVNMRIRLLQAIRDAFGEVRHKLEFDEIFSRSLTAAARHHQDLMRLAYSFPGMPPTSGNMVKVQKDAEESYPDMFEAIAGAKDYIHAMYYILRPDETGIKLRDILTERAKAGVEVRLMYDDIGSWSMKLKFFEPLVRAGGQVREYRPGYFSRFRGAYANFRNHRKILVVDGKTAYTGGINIGDEYLGKDKEIGCWRDTNIKLTGPAANHLQLIFAEDWFYVTGEMLGTKYLAGDWPEDVHGEIVQVVPSGPDRQIDQVAKLYFTAITSAQKRLYITTPYFIPDESVQTALVAASLRGVDVRLLVPLNFDRKIIKYASMSYFKELLEVGCKIYQYKKGFIHSKTMSVDGELGIVGTANMDVRSFRLNFEVCAVCYSKAVAEKLDTQFFDDLEYSMELNMKRFKKRRRTERFLENMARLMSAVL